MKTIEIILPNHDNASVTIDNHLVGYLEWYYTDGEYETKDFRIPLPDGNWRILNQDYRDKIILGDYT